MAENHHIFRELEIDAESAGARIDKLLAEALGDLSRSRIKALIVAGALGEAGGATITDPSFRVKPGQRFVLAVPPPIAARPRAQAIAIDVVYEDGELIVIDKPAGLVVHPAPGNPDRTLVNALISHCGDSLSGIGGVLRPGIVHRLDKDTSGLLVAAKTDRAHRALAAQFADRSLSRGYVAVVRGVPRPAVGEITGNIGRGPANRKKMAVLRQGGRPALTRYRVIERFAETASLIDCRLATGRTHQIRVHLAHRGHPLVGDPVYGRRRPTTADDPLTRAMAAFPRQALHAGSLSFIHPVGGRRLSFARAVPADLAALIAALHQGALGG